MSHPTRLGLSALLLLALACKPTKTETAAIGVESTAAPANLSPDDEAAIRAIDAAWARGATAGDGNAVAALYTADATLLPPGEESYKGDAAKKYWTDFFGSYAGPTELSTSSIEGRGDLAIAVGTYKMTMTEKKPGAKALPTEDGKYIEVLKRQSDGSWKLFYDIWNLNPTAKTK